MKPTIIIEVRGGMVRCVSATQPEIDMEVFVVDYDAPNELPDIYKGQISDACEDLRQLTENL